MSEITWTPEELAAFDRATGEQDSRDQVTRIRGRLAMRRLIREHGREKCDAMFAELLRQEKLAK